MASKLTQYNVGLYMRLSKEDEDKTYKTDDSGSIKNQCAYLHDYVNNLNAKSSNLCTLFKRRANRTIYRRSSESNYRLCQK